MTETLRMVKERLGELRDHSRDPAFAVSDMDEYLALVNLESVLIADGIAGARRRYGGG